MAGLTVFGLYHREWPRRPATWTCESTGGIHVPMTAHSERTKSNEEESSMAFDSLDGGWRL